MSLKTIISFDIENSTQNQKKQFIKELAKKQNSTPNKLIDTLRKERAKKMSKEDAERVETALYNLRRCYHAMLAANKAKAA